MAAARRIQVDFVDFGDAAAVRAALAKPAALVWIETPSNPLLRITDIAAVAELAHQAQAPWWRSTTPSCRRPGSSRLRSAPTSWCTRRRSTSTATATWSAERSLARRRELHERLGWWANYAGPHRFAVRQLPDAARPAHAPRAAGRARPQCPGPGGMPGRASGGQPGLVSGLADPCRPSSSPRASSAASAPSCHSSSSGVFPAVKRFVDGLALLHVGGVARRRREPRRPPGDDDARGDGRTRAARSGPHRRAACACRSASKASMTCAMTSALPWAAPAERLARHCLGWP